MQLTLAELTHISRLYQNVSDLSMLGIVQSPLEGNEEKTLEEKGIMENGQLLDPMDKIFHILAHANQSARVVIKYKQSVLEKGVYRLGDLRVLIESHQGEIIISMYDQEADSVRQEISEYTGQSILKNSHLDSLLSENALMLVLYMADWFRKNVLLDYVSDHIMPSFTRDELLQFLKGQQKGSLAQVIGVLYHLQDFDVAHLDKAIQELTSKKLVVLKEGVFSFSEAFLNFSENFLLPNTEIILETMDASHEGPIIAASNVILQAGLRDVVAFNATSEGVEMKTLSGAELLSRIQAYLLCPSLK